MGVKIAKGYKKKRKHRRNCDCRKCIMVRDAQQQAQQLESIGVSKFMIRGDWGDEHGNG